MRVMLWKGWNANRVTDCQPLARYIETQRKEPVSLYQSEGFTLQNTGYALEVDGRIKTEFQTKEGAQKGAAELKSRFPSLQIKIYDASSKTRETAEVT
jgi:hypothetical protein